MQKIKKMPAFNGTYPPGYSAYIAKARQIEAKVRSIKAFGEELINDPQKAKEVLIKIGVLQPNGKTTYPYRHLRFPRLEDSPFKIL
ncbi:hypothetical protein SAMN05444266_104509 [Chitinophaga jiangningensis]|uniref:Uncharacterized protein n=1 Tax=Chitinophaga jiangningensis TaxID=1419482 RepID=A0A1M7CWT3_9BACT|nr:hypothetical protein [Chitinophaga jiangningensis]SHL71702.1 hypothetical protein SAMN05444266_104509 [Chitinophaga jiangningensis]